MPFGIWHMDYDNVFWTMPKNMSDNKRVNIFNKKVNYFGLLYCAAYPQTKSLSHSTNVVAGDMLEVNCRTWGWPLPSVNWTKEDGQPLNLTDRRISIRNSTILRIEVLYCCHSVIKCSHVNYLYR